MERAAAPKSEGAERGGGSVLGADLDDDDDSPDVDFALRMAKSPARPVGHKRGASLLDGYENAVT